MSDDSQHKAIFWHSREFEASCFLEVFQAMSAQVPSCSVRRLDRHHPVVDPDHEARLRPSRVTHPEVKRGRKALPAARAAANLPA